MRKPRQKYFPELAGKLFFNGVEVETTDTLTVSKSLVGICRDCGRRLTCRNAAPYPDPATDDPTPVVLCSHCYDKRLELR